MAENSGRTSTKPPLTTYQLIAIVAAIVALAALTYFAFRLFTTGVEPPIRVRNGSMEIELGSGKWVGNGNGWSPSGGKPSSTYAVEVRTASGHSCPAQDPQARWQVVSITYSDNVRILLTPSASSNTVVAPKRELENPINAPRLLRHGMPGVGYISQIDLRGGGNPWSCTFTAAQQLSVINICPGSNPACQ